MYVLVLYNFMHMIIINYGYLSSWITGVELESQKFPVRYIVELLNKRGCTVVLTGIYLYSQLEINNSV